MSPDAVWNAVLGRARTEFGKNFTGMWLHRLTLKGTRDGRLVLEGRAPCVEFLTRRHGAWLGDAVREASDLEGVILRTAGRGE